MKFRLSTALLVLTIVAISVGWYVDHNYRDNTDLIGTWHYGHGGYSTTLHVRSDGSFTKRQVHRTSVVSYTGTYQINDSGIVIFDVTNIVRKLDPQQKSETVDESIWCRWAIDQSGYLLVRPVLGPTIPKEIGIRWEVFRPNNE